MIEIIELIKKDKKLFAIVAAGIAGVLVLIFLSIDDGSKEISQQVTENVSSYVSNSSAETESMLEKKLESIISQVKGAGEITATVAVKSSGEYLYAENIKEDYDGDSQSKNSEVVIHKNQNGADTGLIIGVKNPEIIGVAVVCEGGDSSVIRAEITNLITSLFGIGADRVYVGTKAAD